MDKITQETAQKLAEAFLWFSRLNWYHSPNNGLKPSELVVLNLIKKERQPADPGIRVSEISRLLNVTSPTITQIIRSLEDKGLIDRNTDQEDRRAVRIKLTGSGENILAETARTFYASFNGLVEHLGESKSKQLAGILTDVFAYFRNSTKQNN